MKATLFAILFLTLVIIIASPAFAGGGCVDAGTLTRIDHAAQQMRYNHPAGVALNQARIAARANHAPAWVKRRIALAMRYYRRGRVGLAKYHLFYVTSHACW